MHEPARRHLPRPSDAHVPGIVLAEAFARLRGAPFQVSATSARDILRPWFQAE